MYSPDVGRDAVKKLQGEEGEPRDPEQAPATWKAHPVFIQEAPKPCLLHAVFLHQCEGARLPYPRARQPTCLSLHGCHINALDCVASTAGVSLSQSERLRSPRSRGQQIGFLERALFLARSQHLLTVSSYGLSSMCASFFFIWATNPIMEPSL